MDALINANPFAQKTFEFYKPIARTSVNAPAGVIIDLLYGFVLGFIFLMIYQVLPGDSGIFKGLVFALIIWFLRVFMNAASQWMMFNIPFSSIIYILITGLIEMIVLGMIYGIFLKPEK
jgi:hypothetical protein